ncbi:fumarylacetoacetase [Exophiala sideris]|uniref:Fumarylacetoacetase n=1 Tax=Exophiala sideris TaxID=1016849 RepID=A0A0D1YA25_9EURO|nr:fumarylacetoacetase [Exophiala sideris]
MYDEHFSINNIPYGIATSDKYETPSVATREAGNVIFIPPLLDAGLLGDLDSDVDRALRHQTLNAFAQLPRSVQRKVRSALQHLLQDQTRGQIPSDAIVPVKDVQLHLPVHASEFTDFSCSKDHNLKAGEAILGIRKLPPSFLHLPIGYGGRASSIVVSGTPITRPKGHYRHGDQLVYDTSRALDYELEIACIVGKPLEYGTSVQRLMPKSISLVLSRDIQGFEMMPLGPLMGKNFGTTISPWVVTLDALEPFRTAVPNREIPVASHLEAQDTAFNIQFQAKLIPPNVTPTADMDTMICTSQLTSWYWSFAHLVAHQAAGGCGLRTGDVLATGTISGPGKGAAGCLLEATRGGKEDFEITLQDGTSARRTYLEDGDTILITGQAVNHDGTSTGVGFGECIGTIAAGSAK